MLNCTRIGDRLLRKHPRCRFLAIAYRSLREGEAPAENWGSKDAARQEPGPPICHCSQFYAIALGFLVYEAKGANHSERVLVRDS